MGFPPQFLDELRGRVGLVDLIARRVKLVHRGREHTGLCPFHNEKSPSFTVSEDKGFYHCFGCGAHGDAVGFVMRTENLSFVEAVNRLAGDAGLEIPKATPEDVARAKRAASMYEIQEAACAWFVAQLQGSGGASARRYLEQRGVAGETVERFRLGLAPDARGALKAALLAKGIAEGALVEAGLLGQADDNHATYDRFRGRLMFPITDPSGRVVAFGGRTLGDGQPKYLNSPETPLFHKGRMLYALAAARVAARDAASIVVVEGYLDAIALHQAGFANVVAPLGTALTEDQLALLWRAAPEVVICLDGDAAGQRAALRAVERALPSLAPGRTVRVALLPPGEDPDSLVRTRGRAAFQAALAAAVPVYELLWRVQVLGRKGGAASPKDFTPDERAAIDAELDAQAERIGDARLRFQYRSYFRTRIRDFMTPEPRPRATQRRRPGWAPPHQSLESTPADSLGAGRDGIGARREIALVRAVLNHPALLDRIDEDFARLRPASPRLDEMRGKILEVAAATPDLDSGSLRRQLREYGFSDLLDGDLAPSDWGQGSRHFAFDRADAPLDAVEAGWRDALERHEMANLVQERLAAERELARTMTPEAVENLNAIRQLMEARHQHLPGDADSIP